MAMSSRFGVPTFNSFATGNKRYGVGYGAAATSGALSSDGYSERERKNKERRRALNNRLKQQSGTYSSSQEGM